MGTREGCRWPWLHLAFGVIFLLVAQGVKCEHEHEPTESECRPYIVKALKEHHVDDLSDAASSIEQEENPPIDETSESHEDTSSTEQGDEGGSIELEEPAEDSIEDATTQQDNSDSIENADGEDQNKTDESIDTAEETEQAEQRVDDETNEAETGEEAAVEESQETTEEVEAAGESQEATEASGESGAEAKTSQETGAELSQQAESSETVPSGEQTSQEVESKEDEPVEGSQDEISSEASTGEETQEVVDETSVETNESVAENAEAGEDSTQEEVIEGDSKEESEATLESSAEGSAEPDVEPSTEEGSRQEDAAEESDQQVSRENETQEQEQSDETTAEVSAENASTAEVASEDQSGSVESQADKPSSEELQADQPAVEAGPTDQTPSGEDLIVEEDNTQETSSESQEVPEEDLTKETIIPDNLRSRNHITQILRLDEESIGSESALEKSIDSTLKTLKSLYDNAIKPLEILYKYRDLSNRHFGDPEIFSKPLVLFMGPWSGGKSSTINYLLNLEFTELALRTGAEPSPAYFNILTYGEETEILDGTQLAADWTFSGLQKFGQGLLDRLRGVKLKNRLLEKVNIVEIPGILEIRKQVQRLFPFNDACQWFIDRADIIFLVYDPAKLDVGPETEAILDQLKGREYQTRIILNKADQVKPEELMRVQGTLIWNISPLMSSQEPPVMYTTSLWSLPYESSSPSRLLLAQERAFLRDLREAIDKRVENKIASARRFAVRVRNHAKMVDCYLTTYYNHKTFFGNKKKISDDIIESPQKYHIYEGLSTLTNISRYDLPDPEMYKDFFRINPLYDFTKLSDTCTYFRGCPINKLDITIAYELPELVGKYKKGVEASKPKS